MVSIIPKLTQLSPRVWRILGCNPSPMTLQGTNTYLIGTGEKRLLLDTGDEGVPDYISNLRTVLEENKISLHRIIVTHWHHDHVGGVADVFNSFNLSLKDCTVSKYPRSDGDETPLSGHIPLTFLKNGEVIKLEGATLKIIHTPGHTTDHIVLRLEEENAVFSGDCILGEGTTVFEDLHDYMLSLKTIVDLKTQIIYPGHGPVINDPMERLQQYIEHRNKREQQFLAFLSQNPDQSCTARDIVLDVYKEIPEHLYDAAEVNVVHHLEKLCKENKVRKGDDGRYSVTPSSRSMI